MPDDPADKDEPVLITRIDGEDVRLLVHIERLEGDGPQPEEPPGRSE
jgi:hypothetical protein